VTAAIADRVRDTTTSTGTGAIVLANSPPGGYQSFASGFPSAPVSDVMYVIADQNAGPNWEFGSGTFNGSTGLTRDTVLASSNGGSLVNFATGTKDVFVSIPAERAVLKDASGNIVGDWIPRTGNLASLEALAATLGELASAIDTPAIVQFTGTAGGAVVFFPWTSSQSASFAGSGAVAGTIPCTSSIVRATIGAGVTSFTGTLQNGYVDGQPLTVQFISTPSVLTSITVNGSVLATNSGSTYPFSNNIPTAPILSARFQWQASSTSWVLLELTTLRATSDAPESVNQGFSNAVTGSQAVGLGIGLTATGVSATAVGVRANAAGDQSYAGGLSAKSYGFGSLSFNQGIAAGDQSLAVGAGTTVSAAVAMALNTQGNMGVYGPYGVCLGAGNGNFFNFLYGSASTSINGAGTGNQSQGFSFTTVGGTFPGAVTLAMSSIGTAPFVLETGVQVSAIANNNCYLPGTITNISGTTVTVAFTNSQNTSNPATAISPNSTLYENSSGQLGVGIGGTAAPLNLGEVAISEAQIASVGDTQFQSVTLGIQTTSNTANVVLTTTGTAVNSSKAFGNSNRLVLRPGQAIGGTLTVVAKQNGSANCGKWTYDVLAVNNGGAISVSSSLNKALGNGSTQWSTTWVATPPITIAGNSAQQSLDVEVTGLSSTTINWVATFLLDATTTSS
jgi:hypothetical protein